MKNNHAVAAVAPTLRKRYTVEDGFRQVVAACLSQILGNRAAIADNDPEGLHQMRVGVRRLCCAFDLFDHVVPVPLHLHEQLDWLSSALSPARDWSVLCDETLARAAAAAPGNADLPPLLQAAADMARARRRDARSAVLSPRFTELMHALSVWLDSAAWRNALNKAARAKLEAGLPRFTERCLKRGRRRLRRRARRLAQAAPRRRHKLRLAVKAARYAAEFFCSLYQAEPVAAYIDKLAALQDELGQCNDAAVAGRLLRRLQAERPDLHAGVEIVDTYLHAAHARQQLRRMWKCVKKVELPRKR